MPRPLNLAVREAIYAPQTEEVFIILLTINHADLPTPIRVSSDAVATTSRGEIYVALPFRIALPEETADTIPKVKIQVNNVDRRIVEAVRTITGRATVTIEVILASSPDEVIAGPFSAELEDVEFDYLVVSGTLGGDPILSLPFPADRFTPDTFAALFRSIQ